MTSLTLVIDKRRKKKDGTRRICLLLYHDHKQVYIPIGYYVEEQHWDQKRERVRSSCRAIEDLEEFNNCLLFTKTDGLKVIEKLRRRNELDGMDALDIRNRILNLSDQLSFYEFAEHLISELRSAKRLGNAMVYEQTLRFLKRSFPKKDHIFFNELTYRMLKKLETQYQAKNETTLGLRIYMQTIRAMYNRAVKEGKALEEDNPFKKYSIKASDSHKEALTLHDLYQLEIVLLGPEGWCFARDLFMFSFYCMGMNFMDMALLKMKDIGNKHITYKRSKTGKMYSIGIHPKIKKILDTYTGGKGPDDYAFPIIEGKKKYAHDEITDQRHLYNRRLKRLGNQLKISKPLHSNLARHSWANLANQKNLPLSIIQQGLGHKDPNTTQIYLDQLPTETIDLANKKIYDDLMPEIYKKLK